MFKKESIRTMTFYSISKLGEADQELLSKFAVEEDDRITWSMGYKAETQICVAGSLDYINDEDWDFEEDGFTKEEVERLKIILTEADNFGIGNLTCDC